MRRLRVFLLRVHGLVRARQLDRDLHDEIAGHLEEATDEYVRHGYSPTEARLAALRSFGGVAHAQDSYRDARSFEWLDHLRRDTRQAVRMLRRSPGFAAVAILSLALGIGANTAIFSLWTGVLHSSLPGVDKPEQLVMLSNPDDTGMWSGRWEGRTDGPRSWLTYNLQRADLGFPAARLVLVRVDVREAARDATRRDGLTRELLEAFQRIPGVRMASFSQLGVFTGGNSSDTIEVEGYAPIGDKDRGSATDAIGPGYFSALGVPIALGREILENDRRDAPRVCVVNEAFARQFFARRNPIGMRVTSLEDNEKRTTYQVVGVAKNARTHSLRGDVQPRYFVPAGQRPSSANSPTFLIRTATDTAPVMATVRQTIQRVDPALPIMSVRSIDEQMAPLTAQDRTTAQLAVVFGCIALTLAAIGLYGVLSYGVARRTGEIAIRIALGAQPRRVISMILRETIGVVCAGLALGGGLAYAASHLINSRLYGVAPQDPLTLALATALLLVAALCAAYLPAQRASRLDPMVALRQE